MPSRAATTRDAGLALIRRINHWMIAGAIALSGVISLVAARSFHGRTVATSSTAPSQASGPSSSSVGGGALQQPSGAPSSAPAQSAPAVVSGGS
jgi:hypothetical protein